VIKAKVQDIKKVVELQKVKGRTEHLINSAAVPVG